MKVELTKDEINLLDSVLTNELIRVEDNDGNLIVSKGEYKILSDLLRKIEDASVEVNRA